jgi:hypothetical protein
VTSVTGLTFLPMARFARYLLCNCSPCSVLKAARPQRYPYRVTVSPGLSPSSCFSDRWGQNCLELPMLLHLLLLLCVQSLLSFRRVPTPPQCPDPHFSQSNGRTDYLLCDIPLYGLPEGLVDCCPASQTWLLSPAPSSDAVAGCPVLPQT